eukprot:m51a1_g6886 hypothetical protein (470) ;mRNA; f:245558-247606
MSERPENAPAAAAAEEAAAVDEYEDRPDKAVAAAETAERPPTPAEAQAVARMRQELASACPYPTVPASFTDDRLLLDYLREQAGSEAQAIAFARVGEEWRRDFRPQDIHIGDVQSMLVKYEIWGAPPAKNGYPIIWLENFGVHNPSEDNQLDIVRSVSYLGQVLLSPTVRKFNIYVNLKTLAMRNFDERLERLLMEILELAHPNTLAECVLVNAPMWIKALFVIVNPWLPKKWKDKIAVVKGGSSAGAALQRRVDASQLPVRFGGSAPDASMCAKAFVAARAAAEGPTLAPHVPDERLRLWMWKPLVPAAKLQGVAVKGKLKKLGTIVKSWKNMYCALLPQGALMYFKSDSDGIPMGTIVLDNVRIEPDAHGIPSGHPGFAIVTPLRAYLFYAKNIKARDEWVAAITDAIHHVRAAKDHRANLLAPSGKSACAAAALEARSTSGIAGPQFLSTPVVPDVSDTSSAISDT